MTQTIVKGANSEFIIVDDMLKFRGRVCILSVDKLKGKILVEAYNSLYTTYIGSVKMYQDLRKSFQWSGMKRI